VHGKNTRSVGGNAADLEEIIVPWLLSHYLEGRYGQINELK
jgi:hypothetical protein